MFFRFVHFVAVTCIYNKATATADVLSTRHTECSCGYLDGSTGDVFTESIIVYFNETNALAPEFSTEIYTNHYEKSWNSIYRQGASASNVQPNSTDGSLALHVSRPQSDHVVVGGGIRTLRQDIQYGSFRSLLRPAGQDAGGTSLSMVLQYNESQSIHLDVMNTDDPTNAWVTPLLADEFPSRVLGTNFSTLGENSSNLVNPWDFTEHRIDWTEKGVTWFSGGIKTRSLSRKTLPSLPSVPCPMYLKHWSIGNTYSMQGPPRKASVAVANIGWVRLFFNSSLMTDAGHAEFDSRCHISHTCSTEDWSLRTSSLYSAEASIPWKQNTPKTRLQWIAIWMAIACLICSTLLLIHTLLPRAISKFTSTKEEPSTTDVARESEDLAIGSDQFEVDENDAKDPTPKRDSKRSSARASTSKSEFGSTNFRSSSSSMTLSMTERKLSYWQQGGSARSSGGTLKGKDSEDEPRSSLGSRGATPLDSRATTMVNISLENVFPYEIRPPSSRPDTGKNSPVTPGFPEDSRAATMVSLPFLEDIYETEKENDTEHEKGISEPRPESIGHISVEGKGEGKGKEAEVVTTEQKSKAPSMEEKTPLATKQRVDYLAGLTAMCAIIVSVDHFCSTFTPAVVFPGAPHHYISEVWANKIVTPYLMNQIWIGVFFTCSTRFLVARYLREGKLVWIAEKAVTRNFRVMIPITSVAMLEYFLMECGATKWLQYLPSITWSTWPYAVSYSTFGDFLSEILELVYLVPNAAPQIIYNYCTGVLWTIPVQLQGSWLILLGVIVAREIKNPWKRFSYYAFCVILHWYASSWGTYFWLGLMLADLDITYKYRKWVQARPVIFYTMTFTYALITLLSLSIDVINNQLVDHNFVDMEHRIHPDAATGLPIYQVNPTKTSAYFIPRLNGITFAFALQSLIELSPFFQTVFGCKPLTWVFPHIFTIYLFHGLIFWTLGAMVCVFLAVQGFNYGVNLFIVALCCYSALVFSLPFVTPLVEVLGKKLTKSIWENASEVPPPRRPTLFPFDKDLLIERVEPEVVFESGAEYVTEKSEGKRKEANSNEKVPEYSEKGKGVAQETVIEIGP